MSQSKIVLVTGSSSGMGRATVELFAQHGYTVFGTSREPSRVGAIPGATVLPLDVRSDESVRTCADAVLRQTGRLDLLVNNAGYMLEGAVEETSLEEAKAQVETNFWGTVRMVKAVLPTMREQGSGQIISISSMAGVTAMPFAAFYAASKFALEGYSQALRHEVKPFGIRVSVVEPTGVRTRFEENVQHTTSQVDAYAPWNQRTVAAIHRGMRSAIDPSPVAALILRIAEDPAPRLRYQVGKMAGQFYVASRLMPEGLFEQFLRSQMHLDDPALPKGHGARAGGHA